jgi:CHAT domain-containing protein/predicted negative regulator of RcsB-dependent stress response
MDISRKMRVEQPRVLPFLLLVVCGIFGHRVFAQATPWYEAPGFRSTNGNPEYSHPTNNVGSIINAPNANSRPTPDQTRNYIDNHPAFRGIDPGTKNAIIYSGAGSGLLNGAYLPNGSANPFNKNGQTTPNWYIPSTWSSPTMNWHGVQPNGFLPSTVTSTINNFNRSTTTTTYTPPSYTPPRSVPPISHQPPSRTLSPTQQDQQPPKVSTPEFPNLRIAQPVPSTLGPSASDLRIATSSRERALALSETADDKIGQATNHAALAELFVQQGQLELAFTHIHAAETISASSADPAVHLEILRTKGTAYMAAGSFESAIQAYEEALSAMPLADNAGQAQIETSLGWAHQSTGDIQQALKSYRRAQILFRQAGDKDGEVNTALAVGSLYESLGEPEKAVEQYKSVAMMATKAQLARMLVSTAETWLAVNRPEDALLRYKRALSLVQPTTQNHSQLPVFLPPWEDKSSEIPPQEKVLLEISILAGMGRSHMAMSNFWQADLDFERALEKAKASENRSAEASIIASLGELAFWNEISNPQLDCFQTAPFGTVCSWKKRGFSQALKKYNEAMPLMRAAANRMGEIGILTNTGLVYDAKGKRSDALHYYEQALEKMDELETAARLEEFRINIASQSSALYQRVIELEARQHHMEEAFNLSERARARTFLDQLGNPRIDSSRNAPVSFLQREKQLRQESILLRRQLGQEVAKAGPEVNSDKVQSLQTRLSLVRRQYEDAVSQLKISNPEYASVLSISPLTLREAQKQLDPDETLVSYFTTPQMTLAFVITKNSFHAEKLPVTSSKLSLAITTFLDFAGKSEDSSDLQFLYNSLIEPIKDKLHTTKLTVVPHGVLHDLPFAALTPDGKSYLNDHYAIAYLPSVSILPYVKSRVKPYSSKILVLANNQEEGVPQLNYAYDEARWVASLFGTQPLLGTEATPSALRAKADEASIVHLIAHFDFDPENSLSTRVLLGRDTEHEEPLDIGYITSLDLRHTNLVVLSGCQTHLGKRSRGDDVIGLSRAFMYAGSPSVIASLWSVDDNATENLMIAFYTHLKEGLSKAESLRLAQADIRRQFSHPYYWAGFVLTGDRGESNNLLQARTIK